MNASNLFSFISTWATGSAAIVTAAVSFRAWISEDDAKAFAQRVRTTLQAGPRKWAESISIAFLTFFDYIYGSRGGRRDRLLWVSIFGPYVLLLIGRIVLFAFR